MPADQPAALEPLLAQARELLLVHQNPSVAFLQRHLKIGYGRALGMMQSLEGDIVTAPNADGWRRMLHSGNRSPCDPLRTALYQSRSDIWPYQGDAGAVEGSSSDLFPSRTMR